jgi:hypothetical protein
MARVSAEKRAELESFWRSHHEGWKNSRLNQREWSDRHGIFECYPTLGIA